MLTSDPFLLQNFLFPCTVLHSQFQEIWRPEDIAVFASANKFLSFRLQLWFPLFSLPTFTSRTHPSSLKLFLSSLLSRFHSFHSPSHVLLPRSHPHEMGFILASLLKLVLFLSSHSFSPIVSLSLPPCSSVSVFVTQLSFLAHLVPLPPSTRAGIGLGSFFTPGPRAKTQVCAAARNEAPVAAETLPKARTQASEAETRPRAHPQTRHDADPAPGRVWVQSWRMRRQHSAERAGDRATGVAWSSACVMLASGLDRCGSFWCCCC